MTAMLDDEVAELRRANAELHQRLDEGLAREAATAEILQVINSSPGELEPVFEAMLDKATLLSEAAFGVLWTYDGELFQARAFRNVPPAFAEFLRDPQKASPTTVLGPTFPDGNPLRNEPPPVSVSPAHRRNGTEGFPSPTEAEDRSMNSVAVRLFRRKVCDMDWTPLLNRAINEHDAAVRHRVVPHFDDRARMVPFLGCRALWAHSKHGRSNLVVEVIWTPGFPNTFAPCT
jgi:hypothetical protein